MIDTRYTLFNRIPLWRDADGTWRTDPLWAKDILLHLEYLSDFNICCPVITRPESEGSPLPGLDDDRIFALRIDKGWGSVARNFIPNFAHVRRAVEPGGIMHSGGAGWAFPCPTICCCSVHSFGSNG